MFTPFESVACVPRVGMSPWLNLQFAPLVQLLRWKTRLYVHIAKWECIQNTTDQADVNSALVVGLQVRIRHHHVKNVQSNGVAL